jgi:hypothetical protein
MAAFLAMPRFLSMQCSSLNCEVHKHDKASILPFCAKLWAGEAPSGFDTYCMNRILEPAVTPFYENRSVHRRMSISTEQ